MFSIDKARSFQTQPHSDYSGHRYLNGNHAIIQYSSLESSSGEGSFPVAGGSNYIRRMMAADKAPIPVAGSFDNNPFNMSGWPPYDPTDFEQAGFDSHQAPSTEYVQAGDNSQPSPYNGYVQAGYTSHPASAHDHVSNLDTGLQMAANSLQNTSVPGRSRYQIQFANYAQADAARSNRTVGWTPDPSDLTISQNDRCPSPTLRPNDSGRNDRG
jgi:hypothetical protein